MPQLTTAAVARRWRIHPTTVNRYRLEGKLEPLGKRGAGSTASYIYDLSEVERFERENQIAVAERPDTRQ